MTEPTDKNLSRRDALKVLSAALGATALTALPLEWSKPALAVGELPEHARQSGCEPHAFSASGLNKLKSQSFEEYNAPPNVSVNYTIRIIGSGTFAGEQIFTGTMISDKNGNAGVVLTRPSGFMPGDQIRELWEWDGGSNCYVIYLN